MQFVVIKPNTYQDSLRLIRLSNLLESTDGVSKVSVMMGTPVNKDQLDKVGMLTDEIANAGPTDLIITAEVDSESFGHALAERVNSFLLQPPTAAGRRIRTTRSLDGATRAVPNATIGMVSIPGEYAAKEARRLLDRGINVFLFSDNVSVKEEISLKEQARDAGLIVMGPDCGTAYIAGAPLGFVNAVAKGNIGIAAASGTGCQEVMVHVTRLGGGVSHAIGLGGRDLTAAVGGIACRQALTALAADPATDVIVMVSKPPAPRVRAEVIDVARRLHKPVVAAFTGESGDNTDHDGIWLANGLFDAALLAVELAGTAPSRPIRLAPEQKYIRGIFTGGTLASEAALIVARALAGAVESTHSDGYILRSGGHEVLDLGADLYTRGKPHPMIDPSVRTRHIAEAIADPTTAAVLVDVVLGYGSHSDPAGVLAEGVAGARSAARAAGHDVAVVAAICGTDQDQQNLAAQRQTLQNSGIVVMPSNASAARYAVNLAARKTLRAPEEPGDDPVATSLLFAAPAVINIGLQEFSEALVDQHIPCVHYAWQPAAGGDKHLQDLLAALR